VTPNPASTNADFLAEREHVLLAPYAMHSADSQGRCFAEPNHPYRGPYQRDRDRILHSAAFRRLSRKTQVFTGEMGDYHRTRLTHTLEVASIGRTIARAMRLNEDLVEALALAHDLGHPPFGHSGEDVLNECLRNEGGFNHNAQGLRICELIETSYRARPGLNLSLEVLDGQRRRSEKHLTQTPSTNGKERAISPLLEVQVVDAADSIAYDAHDADDALELGLLDFEQLLEVPLWREASERIAGGDALSTRQHLRAIVHEIIDWQVSDILENAARVLRESRVETVKDVQQSPLLITPSSELHGKKLTLERFLFENVYRHPDLLAKRQPAQQKLRELFDFLVQKPEGLPDKFRRLAATEGVPRVVADYLAGMTDRFAFEAHHRLIGD
jgi:dGTPase